LLHSKNVETFHFYSHMIFFIRRIYVSSYNINANIKCGRVPQMYSTMIQYDQELFC